LRRQATKQEYFRSNAAHRSGFDILELADHPAGGVMGV
jgi:hypothetical protein